MATALRPAASGPQMQAASLAVQALFEDLKFMTTARSRSDAERALHLEMWREREDRALGALVTAAVEMLAGPRDAALQALPI
jgi:hypothetical protein